MMRILAFWLVLASLLIMVMLELQFTAQPMQAAANGLLAVAWLLWAFLRQSRLMLVDGFHCDGLPCTRYLRWLMQGHAAVILSCRLSFFDLQSGSCVALLSSSAPDGVCGRL